MLLCRKWAKHPILTATLIFNYFDQSTHPALQLRCVFVVCVIALPHKLCALGRLERWRKTLRQQFTQTCMALVYRHRRQLATLRERVCVWSWAYRYRIHVTVKRHTANSIDNDCMYFFGIECNTFFYPTITPC